MQKKANLINYCMMIRHAKSRDGKIEEANCKAVLFDQNDEGLVKGLNGNYGSSGQVDYIEMTGNKIVLLELKDLMEKLKCKSVDSILINLDKKYNDSIEIIRKHINSCASITYYVVVKNNTDIVVLDNIFPIRKVKKSFTVCKTNEICSKLSEFNTRLCP